MMTLNPPCAPTQLAKRATLKLAVIQGPSIDTIAGRATVTLVIPAIRILPVRRLLLGFGANLLSLLPVPTAGVLKHPIPKNRIGAVALHHLR